MVTQLYLTSIGMQESVLVGVQNRDAGQGQLYVLQHFNNSKQVMVNHLVTFSGQLPESVDGNYILLNFQGKVIDKSVKEHVAST